MNELMGPIISCLFVKILEIHVVKIVLVVLEENVFFVIDGQRRTTVVYGLRQMTIDNDERWTTNYDSRQ